MLRQLKNLFFSVQTYNDLSPDIEMRRVVNHGLYCRRSLTLQQWFESFWQPRAIAAPVVAFVYDRLKAYSGVEMARVWPGDRLDADLKFSLICWFDWQLNLCEDFQQQFGGDAIDPLAIYNLDTVEELVVFLNSQFDKHLSGNRERKRYRSPRQPSTENAPESSPEQEREQE
ncbi:hypothetical protein [Oxynema aestuarii]|jgi:hypothetical protein|uniref:hypothetical protein n=1 Tax=Oxynema aestuarii TaxID=2874213 RepID=UPI001B311935|nr:hypothetical protein [Oxynema aestuarii]